MKLTVSIITYNHAPYIAQAIESALKQETDFDYEILIGEDESSDGTREIVRDYAARYPDRIRAFFHNRAENLAIGGRATGRRNLVNNLLNARGEYIALLDGDDYWTDPRKLQKQVDFLDAHRDFSMCFHDVTVLVDGSDEPRIFPMKSRQRRHTLNDALLANTHIPTLAAVFRRGLFGDFPEWYFRLRMGDVPLFILNAQHGDIGFLDEKMGVYRVHRGGVWSGGAHFADRSEEKQAWEHLALLEYFEVMEQWLGPEYRAVVREALAQCAYALVWYHQSRGELDTMRRYLRRALRARVFPATIDPVFILKACVLAFVPCAFRLWWSRRAAHGV